MSDEHGEEQHPAKPEEQAEDITSELIGIPEDMLKQVPPKVRQAISMFMMQGRVMASPPITSKINEEHIHKLLDYSHEADRQEYEDKNPHEGTL